MRYIRVKLSLNTIIQQLRQINFYSITEFSLSSIITYLSMQQKTNCQSKIKAIIDTIDYIIDIIVHQCYIYNNAITL